MSSTQNFLLLIILFSVIYLLWKPEYGLKIRERFNNVLGFFTVIEKFPVESEVNKLSLILPEADKPEIIILNRLADEIKSKGEMVPVNRPTLNQFKKLSDVDVKNLFSFLSQKLASNQVVKHQVEFVLLNINENIFYAEDHNYLYLTPLEISGKVSIDKKEIGSVELTVIMRGKTNSLFIPKVGFFVGKNKFTGIIDDFKITKLDKPNINKTSNALESGWYAVSDLPNYSVIEPENPPLIKYKELEDSEIFDLSEIINNREKNNQNSEIEYENPSETNISEQFNY